MEGEISRAVEVNQENSDQTKYVVGIGASAGGLEAIRELATNLPENSGASYVVIQHMSPDHKSLLTELIARETKLPVEDIVDNVALKPDTIFVTPPNTDVVSKDGKLVLLPPTSQPASPKPNIDRFLISLAEDAGPRAMAIILSGTGSDGAYGVQAIREAGGITIAQDDQTAKYDGMPRAAIESGCVDLILSPIQIGTQLAKIMALPRNLEQFRTEEVAEHPFSDLLQVVLARTRVDFRDYKPTTVQRRLERRMTALNINDITEYTAFCRSNPSEVDALFKDLLISVTRFFRDHKEFEAMRPIIRKLVQSSRNKPLRIWVAGCATGEEAYSIAMLFAAEMDAIGAFHRDQVQIFATDIDKEALNRARYGKYARAALADIPEDIADKYVKVDDDYITIEPAIRDMVLFSEHNICQDPPFLHLDLICCRNLLIYFGASLQARVLSRLFYSLSLEGYLFLGAAESVSVTSDLFRAIEGQNHIFRKRMGSEVNRVHLFEPRSLMSTATRSARLDNENTHAKDVKFNQALFEQLVARLGPDGLLVSDDMRIIQVFGNVSRFIEVTNTTKLNFSLSMLGARLSQETRTLATLALRKKEVRKGLVTPNPDQGIGGVHVTAYPLHAPALEEGFVLISLHDHKLEDRRKPASPLQQGADPEQIDNLQNELSSAREALQQTIEELETSNEEFQSTNEELQSSNEELQAANEEMETANEELQSTNEELVTVNEELQIAKTELEALANEQRAVLEGIEVPILIIDTALQVTTANAAATQFFELHNRLNRVHISQVYVPKGFPSLAEICSESIQLGRSGSHDLKGLAQFKELRISPFYTSEGQVRGVTAMLT